jgi:hypothetical protein
MNSLCRISLLLLLLVAACAFLPLPEFITAGMTNRPDAGNAKTVLFIGNSFTSGNNLAHLVEALSMISGPALYTEAVAPGGKDLVWHSTSPQTLKVLDSRHWDYVVLQDCSGAALSPYEQWFERGTTAMAKLLKERHLKPILFMTWADLGRKKDQYKISYEYKKAAARLNAKLAPVGDAWLKVLLRHPKIRLHAEDNHHAAPAGTLLTAYVFLHLLQGHSEQPLEAKINYPPKYLYELLWPTQYEYAPQAVAKMLRQEAS